jgi:hypothetical protein
MLLIKWIRGLCYSGYDWRGDAKYLLGRAVDPTQSDVEGVPPDIRDEALGLLCQAFDIPERQKHCLRGNDALFDIYRSFTGPRFWDELQYERLGMSLDKLPAGKVDPKEFFERVLTVADLVRFTAARRGITRQGGEPETRV